MSSYIEFIPSEDPIVKAFQDRYILPRYLAQEKEYEDLMFKCGMAPKIDHRVAGFYRQFTGAEGQEEPHFEILNPDRTRTPTSDIKNIKKNITDIPTKVDETPVPLFRKL